LTQLHIAGHGADSTRHCTVTNGNASGGTEALKLNQPSSTIDREEEARNRFKLSILGKSNVEAIALEDVVVRPADTAANDLMPEDLLDAGIDLLAAPVVPVAPILRYQLLSDDDLRLLPPVEWRVKGVLPSHGLAVVFGPSGSGKSFLVLDMLQSLAHGRDWFGRRVKPCSATYVALEGEAGVAGRVDAYRLHYGPTSPNIRYMVKPFNLLNADDINELAQAIKTAGNGAVVVLDTLNRATPGSDENDSKAMGQIISAAKILQDLIGGLVLLVHHTGKDASKGMRGHSSLHAALDCAIEIKRNGDHREWLVAKSKDGEDGASHPFKLEVVPLGIDSDGDAITSCVIVANQSAQAIAKKMPTLGSNQTIALKALEEPLRESLDMDKDGAPQGKPCLLFEHALAIVAPMMPVGAKYKKQRAKEALTGLVEKNMLGMKGEWLWVN
jgi:putative DNA primase/helicase